MEPLNQYLGKYGLSMAYNVPPERKCVYCGAQLEIYEVESERNCLWLSCPNCVASTDNLHDFYSIPLSDADIQQV